MVERHVIQEARPYSLDDVFKEHYAVPEFQRPFVWKKRQVQQLFYDLFDAHQERGRGEYFIGSIVTYRDKDRRQYLVDGQQRMLTLISLFAACRDRIMALDENADVSFFDSIIRGDRRTARGKVTVEDRVLARVNPDQEILAQLIRGRGPVLEAKQFPAFQRDLLYAYQYLGIFLREEFGREEKTIRAFTRYILDDVSLVRVQTDSFGSALQIFETINARGIGLSPFDMVKNYLFSLVRASDKNRLEKLWGTVQGRLEDTIGAGSGSQTATSVRFLRYFVMAQYDTKTVLQARNAYTWVKDNILTRKAGSQGAMQFAQSMERSSMAFRNLHQGYYPGQAKTQPLLRAINDMGAGVRQHYPLLMAAQGHPDDVVDALTASLERLTVIFLLAGVSWNELERKIPEWSGRIRSTKTKSGMETFIRSSIRPLADEHVKSARQDMWMLGEQGRAIERYVLTRMTEAIQVKAGKARGLKYYTDRDVDITIEHVLPQNKESDAAKPFASVSRLEDYIYQLGNLTLLYRVDNSYNNDGDFDYKRDTFSDADQFHLTRFLGNSTPGDVVKRVRDLYRAWPLPSKWNPQAVERRSEKMMRLADDIWDLQPSARSSSTQALE
jgi:hypothetical protein